MSINSFHGSSIFSEAHPFIMDVNFYRIKHNFVFWRFSSFSLIFSFISKHALHLSNWHNEIEPLKFLGWVFINIGFKVIISFQIPSTNIIFGYKHFPKFYNSSLTLASTLPDLLVCGFHRCCALSNFIFVLLLTWNIFLGFLLLFLQTLQKNSLCVILFLLFHIPFSSFTTIYVPFVIWWQFMLLDVQSSSSRSYNSRMTFIFKHVCYVCFSAKFLHIFKDVSYDSNNLVSSFLY